MTEKNSDIEEKERLLFPPSHFSQQNERITVQPKVSLEFLRTLTMHRGMGNFFRSFTDPPLKTKEMLRNLIKDDERNIVTVAFNEKNEIIGYISVIKPQEKKFDLTHVYEIGAIEVSRAYRKGGMGMNLMRGFENSFFNDKIVYTFCYSWHWDCSKESMKEYREALLTLLHSQNFSEESIDDINMKMDENNIFAVRYGKDVDRVLREEFKKKLI
jgi:hypothetical protein